MTITYADAITAETSDEIRDGTLLPALAAAGSTVGGAPTSSPDRALVEGEAGFLALEQQLRSQMATACSIVTAPQAGDAWVDADATWYATPRNPATPAVWSLPLKCSPTSPVTISPGDQIQAQDAAGNVLNLNLPAGSAPILLNPSSTVPPGNPVGSISTPNKALVPFIARNPGSAANAGPYTNLITSPYAGLQIDASDSAPMVPLLVTPGADAEPSPAFAARCVARWGTLSSWTRLTFDSVIPTAAPLVTRWYVDDSNPFGPGSVGVWIAEAGTSPPATTTDLNAVITALTAIKPLGSGPLSVNIASTLTVTVTAVLQVDGSNPNAAAQVEQNLTTWASALMGPALVSEIVAPFSLYGLLRGFGIVGPFQVQRDATTAVTLSFPAGPNGTPPTWTGNAAGTLPSPLGGIPQVSGITGVASVSTSPATITLTAGQIIVWTFVITTEAV